MKIYRPGSGKNEACLSILVTGHNSMYSSDRHFLAKPKHHFWLWYFDLHVTLWLHFFWTRPKGEPFLWVLNTKCPKNANFKKWSDTNRAWQGSQALKMKKAEMATFLLVGHISRSEVGSSSVEHYASSLMCEVLKSFETFPYIVRSKIIKAVNSFSRVHVEYYLRYPSKQHNNLLYLSSWQLVNLLFICFYTMCTHNIARYALSQEIWPWKSNTVELWLKTT